MNCVNHPEVSAAHYCRTCGKALCSACSRDVMGVIYCEQCLAERMHGMQPPVPPPPQAQAPAAGFVSSSSGYVPPPPGAVHPGLTGGPNPALAGLLSAIFPFGVGAVYCGQYIKGLVHLGIFVFLIVAESSDVAWYIHMFLGISIAFYYVYQIMDAVRTAHAISAGQPAPDPFGFGQTFGPIQRREGGAKMPTGAIVLIILGALFLLNTALQFDLNHIWPLFLIALGFWMFARQWGIIPSQVHGCQCDRCKMRGMTGPAMLMTVGVLWLLDDMGRLDWGHSWPVILIVLGVLKIVQGNTSKNGHVDSFPNQPGGTIPPSSPVTPVEPPQPPSEVSHG
jgi:hypothetical protein